MLRLISRSNFSTAIMIAILVIGTGTTGGQSLLRQPGSSSPAFSAPSAPAQVEVRVVQASVVDDDEAAAVGQSVSLAVILGIAPGQHLYPNPLSDGSTLGLPTQIVPAAATGIEWTSVSYPPGRPYFDKNLKQSYDVYESRVVLFVEGVVRESLSDNVTTGVLNLSGLLCLDETGSCVPWEQQATFTVKTFPFAAEPSDQALFSADQKNHHHVVPAETLTALPETASADNPGKAHSPIVMPDYQPRDWQGQSLSQGDWIRAFLLALAAGAILNLMPCVLPVIPLKVLSIIQQAQADKEFGSRGKAVKLALIFSLGIVAVFVVLALVMSAFQLLYGQQFQSIGFKLVMLLIIFVLSLSMLGLFEVILPARISNIAVVKQGYAGAFGMGVLATLLATPCSAPLLGGVLTWSLSQTTPITVMVFVVIGLGMAGPYVLLTAFPALIDRIPKAGPWMLYLKQGLGFVMLGVSGYLVFLFPPGWHFPLLLVCLLTAFALWLSYQVVVPTTAAPKKTVARFAALIVLACAGWVTWQVATNEPDQQDGPAQPGEENWLVAQLLPLHEAGKTVMVEFTADWCPNCKYVEQTVLKQDAFKQALEQADAELIIADWTHDDPAIEALLTRLGSASIPFTAVFPGNDPYRPIVLRDIYTLETAVEILKQTTIRTAMAVGP